MRPVRSRSWAYYRSAAKPRGVFLPRDKICVSANDRGFLFGDGAYEVIRSYRGRMFKTGEHLARFRHSLEFLGIPFDDAGALPEIAAELIARNRLDSGDAAVYIEVTRGIAERALAYPAGLVPTVYVEARRLAAAGREAEDGVAVVLVPDIRWQRCDIKAIGLLSNVLAQQHAAGLGAAEAVFVRDGIVTEGTHANVFGVRQDVVRTHPAGAHVLPGITRAAVLELCRRLAIAAAETPVSGAELPALDEVFLACTTGEVMPVVRVDGRPVGNGRPGPLTSRLQAAFREHVAAELCRED